MLRLAKHALNHSRPFQPSLPALCARTLPIASVRYNSTAPHADPDSSLTQPKPDDLNELEQFEITDDAPIPWPNLMEHEALYDDAKVIDFPPSKYTPYANSITLLNQQQPEEQKPGLSEDTETEWSLFTTMHPKLFLHRYTLIHKSVVHQTGKGKIRSRAVLVVAGNGNGLLGYGYATDPKSDSRNATTRATEAAIRNMDYVERFENRTVWTEMESKFGSTKIIARPRPVGFGLRCNPHIHQICKAAGIKDLSAKVWGSRRPMMVVHGFIRMLQGGHAPPGMGDGFGGPGKRLAKGTGMRQAEDIERERGRRIIPLRT